MPDSAHARIRLLIADDHPVVRAGLRRILEPEADMEIVAEAATSEEAVAACGDERPDVVLLDLSMPGPGHIETIQRICALEPAPGVLVLSIHPEDQYALRALRAGAMGYLTKDHPAGELLVAIRRVRGGRRYASDALAERLLSALVDDEQEAPHERLSEREYQVLLRLGAGDSVSEIAAMLGLSVKTVSTYRGRILEKMGLRSNVDLIRYVVRNGLEE